MSPDFHAMSSLDGDECEEKPEWPKYINVYRVTQEYGGAEEGGWWFDCGEPIESIRCDNQEQFDLSTKLVEERYHVKDRNKWSRERRVGAHSCMPGAYGISIHAEDRFAESFPQSRPHYE